MAHPTRFNRLRNGTLFISLAAVTAFTAACGSDGSSASSENTKAPGMDNPAPANGGNATSGGSVAAPHAPEPHLTSKPDDVVIVKVHPQAVVEASKSPAAGLSLPSPSALLAMDRSTPAATMHLDAAAFSTKLPNALVSSAGAAATFAPTVDPQKPSSAGVAYAVYRMSAPGFATGGQAQTVRFDWKGDSPDSSKVWIGIARVGADRWDFFAGPDDDVLTIDSFAPYQNEDGDVMLVVALADNLTSTLEGVDLGEPELRGTGLPLDDSPPNLAGQALTSTAPLPRSVNLRPSMPWVRSQGSIGSCTGFAFSGAFNYELNRVYASYGWDDTKDTNQLSPKWLYNQVVFSEGKCPNNGHGMSQVADFIVSNGDATEHNAPYGSTSKSDYSCSTSFYDAAIQDARVLKPVAHHSFSLKGDAGIAKAKEVLAGGNAIVFGIHTDSDFKSYEDGVWNFSGTGEEDGGHAIVMAGYDDDKQAFYVRNSWGYDWGELGYVWIGYESFRQGKVVNREGNAYYLDVQFSLDAAQRLIPTVPDIVPTAHVMASDGDYTDKVVVTWSRDTAAGGYKVYRDTATNLVATITSGSTTSWEDRTLTDTREHQYYVASTAHTSGGDIEAQPGAPDAGYVSADPLTKAVTPTSGTSGSVLTLNVQVVGTGPFTYDWNFDGGATPDTSSDASPSVVLGGSVGVHKAKVTVTGTKGSSTYAFDLVVDYPASVFRHTWGNSSGDFGKSVFADAMGNTYLAGNSRSYGAGKDDFLLLKYDAGGSLAYARTWGTSGYELATGIVADSTGAAYFVGGNDTTVQMGDMVFGKLDPSGQLVFATTIGGPAIDRGDAIAVSPTDDIYVAGHTTSYGSGGSDIAVLKFAPDGRVVWQRTLGTSGADFVNAIATSTDGKSVYVVGTTAVASRKDDLVIAKLSDGGDLGWVRTWGTTMLESDPRIAAGRDGNVYVSCTTHADTLGNQDIAVLSYTPSGSLRFQRAAAGQDYSSATNSNHGIAVDAANNVFVVADYVDGNQSGLYRDYLYKLNADGAFLWARSANDQANQTRIKALAMSPLGKLAFAGSALTASSFTWQPTTHFESVNPTGTSEGPMTMTMAAPAFTMATAVGTFGSPTGQIDYGTTGTEQALAYTYNPNQ